MDADADASASMSRFPIRTWCGFHLFGALDLPHCSRRMAELILSMERSTA